MQALNGISTSHFFLYSFDVDVYYASLVGA